MYNSCLILHLQEKLESEQRKKKEIEDELRHLGDEVKELEPRHTHLKKQRDDTKKAFKAAAVSSMQSLLVAQLCRFFKYLKNGEWRLPLALEFKFQIVFQKWQFIASLQLC